jgi:hypothetical protein
MPTILHFISPYIYTAHYSSGVKNAPLLLLPASFPLSSPSSSIPLLCSALLQLIPLLSPPLLSALQIVPSFHEKTPIAPKQYATWKSSPQAIMHAQSSLFKTIALKKKKMPQGETHICVCSTGIKRLLSNNAHKEKERAQKRSSQ